MVTLVDLAILITPFAYLARITLPRFIEQPMPSKESECHVFSGLHFVRLSLSTNLIFDFGIV